MRTRWRTATRSRSTPTSVPAWRTTLLTSSVTTTRASSTNSRQPQLQRVRSTNARAFAALSGTGASRMLACTEETGGSSVPRELVLDAVDRLLDLVGCVARLFLDGTTNAVGLSFALQ